MVIKKIKYQNNLKQLIFFYKEHYSKTIIDNEILYYDKLIYILPLWINWYDHLNKYVNIVFWYKRYKKQNYKK